MEAYNRTPPFLFDNSFLTVFYKHGLRVAYPFNGHSVFFLKDFRSPF